LVRRRRSDSRALAEGRQCAAGVRLHAEGQPPVQSAGCAGRGLADGAAKLYRAGARPGEGLRERLGGEPELMPQLLIELFSEEIPARMQKRAEEDLAKAFGEKLKAAGLDAKTIKTFSAPRRLGLFIDDLPAKAADVNEEKKGPRVGAPDQAIEGFLKSAGLKSIDQAQIVEDKKGSFYVAKIERAGRATAEIVQQIVPEIVRAFPWPKSRRSQSSDLQWVRPLHNICCVFDGKAVKIAVEGVGSEAVTWGHRFHAPAALPVTRSG